MHNRRLDLRGAADAVAPLFPTGALFIGHMRAKPSDAQILAVISSADGGVADGLFDRRLAKVPQNRVG